VSLMLINPKKRKKARSPAQKAATRRLVASRKTNPAAKTKRRRRNPIGLARVAKRRRNPIGSGAGNIGGMMVNSLKGAVGSVAVNAAVSFLPSTFNSGKMLYVTRAAAALLLGTVGQKVAGKHARAMAEGALTVNFADALNSVVGGMLPGSQLHGAMGEYVALNGMNMAIEENSLQGVGEVEVNDYDYTDGDTSNL